MARGNGSSISAYPVVRMAQLHQHIWTEPRAFDGQDEDHNPPAMDGNSKALYCSPRLCGSRRPEAQGNASAADEIDSDADSPSWLDGPTLETPMPRDIQEFTDAERGAYNLGVTDERLRRARLI